MDIIINEMAPSLPPSAKELPSAEDYWLQSLICLGFSPQSLPLGDWLRQMYQLEGKWVLLHPIHWQATHNDAMIMAEGPFLKLSEKDARTFFEDIAAFLATENISLYFHTAHTWLMRVDGKPAIHLPPTALLKQVSLMSQIQNMDASLYWTRLMTELQMFLAMHPLNQSRMLSVNGLSCYDAGSFVCPNKRPLLTDDERLLQAFKGQFQVLAFDKALPSNSVVLINQWNRVESELSKLIGKNVVRWFWNNCAYEEKTKFWWKR